MLFLTGFALREPCSLLCCAENKWKRLPFKNFPEIPLAQGQLFSGPCSSARCLGHGFQPLFLPCEYPPLCKHGVLMCLGPAVCTSLLRSDPAVSGGRSVRTRHSDKLALGGVESGRLQRRVAVLSVSGLRAPGGRPLILVSEGVWDGEEDGHKLPEMPTLGCSLAS